MHPAEDSGLPTSTFLQDRKQRGLRKILPAQLAGLSADNRDTRSVVSS
jgi:hypothetical protein